MAGLVSGDSDSSDLTQESGDDGAVFTPRESGLTGTDAGTDYEEEPEQENLSGMSFTRRILRLVTSWWFQVNPDRLAAEAPSLDVGLFLEGVEPQAHGGLRKGKSRMRNISFVTRTISLCKQTELLEYEIHCVRVLC